MPIFTVRPYIYKTFLNLSLDANKIICRTSEDKFKEILNIR